MTDDSLRARVLSLEHRVWQAVLDRDGNALEGLFRDDYIEVTVDGKRVLKSEIVELSPKLDEIDSYSIESERVIPLGEEGALLSYRLTLRGRTGGQPIEPEQRWATSVWMRENSTWQCCLFQQSPYLDRARG